MFTTAHSGSSSQRFTPQEAPFLGGGDNPNNEKSPSSPKWSFDEFFYQVAHDAGCDNCEAFLLHCGNASVSERAQFKAACIARNDAIVRNSGLQGTINTQQARFAQIEHENQVLTGRWKSVNRRCDDIEADYEKVKVELEASLTKLAGVQEELVLAQTELTPLRNLSSERKGKKRRIQDLSHSTTSSSPNPDSMVVDNDGTPSSNPTTIDLTISNAYSTPPWDDGTYRAGEDYSVAQANWEKGIPIPKRSVSGRPFYPKFSVATVNDIDKCILVLKSDKTEKVQRRCFSFLKEAVRGVQGKPKKDRSEVENYLLQVHFRPAIFGGRGGIGSSSTSQAINSPSIPIAVGQSSSAAINAAPLGANLPQLGAVVGSTPITTELVPMDITPDTSDSLSTQGSKILQPSKKEPLHRYFIWLSNIAARDGTRPGLIVYPDYSISTRSARGFRFFYCRSPSNRKGASPVLRHRYQILFVELILTPGYYKAYLTQSPIYYPAPLKETSFEGDPTNLTLPDLAEFLRSECVSVAEIEDSALWALRWLQTVDFRDVDSRLEVISLLNRLMPQLEVQGIPAGFNECLYFPDDSIEIRASCPNTNVHNLTEPPVIPTQTVIQPITTPDVAIVAVYVPQSTSDQQV
ncbi:hypothetical protein PM082_022297 [Marasmius tenuissimus]|nr:hypothetical protein PM082_022297 [Marasmius tenuissimus]